MHSKLAMAALAAAALGVSAPAYAAYTVDINQVGANVVATGSGVYAWQLISFQGYDEPLNVGVNPSAGFLGYGTASSLADNYGPVSGPSSFGTGGYTAASSTTGSVGGISGSTNQVIVPPGYGESAPTTPSVTTWDDATFSSLGLTPGTYVWTWGVPGGATDTFTLDIGGGVPEPAAWAMMLLGVGGIGFALRRSQRASVTA
jgi:hypothetical protein